MSERIIVHSNSRGDQALESLGHALAGAVAGAATVCLTSPFNIVSTRLQVQQKKLQQAQQDNNTGGDNEGIYIKEQQQYYKGTLDAFQRIFKEEGWQSFYSGLKAQLIGIGCSSFVYYYLYSYLKANTLTLKKKRDLNTIESLLIAAVSGCGNVITTIPIWVVYTRLQLNPNSNIFDQFKTIIKESGVAGLYKGLVPSLILVSNPSIQFVVYEKIKILWRNFTKNSHFSGLEIFILSAIAKLVAAVLTYPILLIKTHLQAKKGTNVNIMKIILQIYENQGINGFFKGMLSKLAQSVLGSAFLFLVKKKISFYTILSVFLLRKKLFLRK